MKKILFIICVTAAVVSCSDLSQPNSENEPIVLTKAGEEIVEGSKDFAFEFLSRLMASDDGNIFYSPFSIQTALAMAEAGANGQTGEEIHTAIGLGNVTFNDMIEYYKTMLSAISKCDKKTALYIANSFWEDNNLQTKANYKSVLKDSFKAEVMELASDRNKATKEINNWVSKNTSSKIEKIVGNIPPDQAMALINAIYFESEWSEPFVKEYTSDRSFTFTKDGIVKSSKVPFMAGDFKKAECYSDDNLTAVKMDYGNGSFSMRLIMPDQKSTLEEIMPILNSSLWDKIWQGTIARNVRVYLPKYEIEYGISNEMMTRLLKERGMLAAFSASDADFSGISDINTYITQILHKAKIEVDESGTRAAAVSYVGNGLMTDLSSAISFNRPFAYFITENSTGAILFAGVQREF